MQNESQGRTRNKGNIVSVIVAPSPRWLCVTTRIACLGTSLIMLLACLVMAGCGNVVRDKSSAEGAIADFHRLFNKQQFREIYSAAGSALKKTASEKELTDLLSAAHRKLGRVTGSSNQTWKLNKFNLTTRIVMVQNTQFENGKGVETFLFQVSGGRAILLGYNINSKDLITR